MLEVDVDVRRLAPLRRDEALEQQPAAHRVDLGDAEAVADRGVRRRAAALAEDALAARVCDDVVDGEEVRRVIHLRDEGELVRDAGADGVVDAVGIAPRRALPDEMLERRLRRGKAVDLLVGIFVFEFVEREGERLGKRERFFDRLRRVAEQPRHLRRRLEVALGIGGKQAAGAVDGRLLADAGEHVGERPSLRMVHVHVVDGDQRHARLARHLFQAREPRAVIAAIEHGRGQAHTAGGGGAQTRECVVYPRRVARTVTSPRGRGG